MGGAPYRFAGVLVAGFLELSAEFGRPARAAEVLFERGDKRVSVERMAGSLMLRQPLDGLRGRDLSLELAPRAGVSAAPFGACSGGGRPDPRVPLRFTRGYSPRPRWGRDRVPCRTLFTSPCPRAPLGSRSRALPAWPARACVRRCRWSRRGARPLCRPFWTGMMNRTVRRAELANARTKAICSPEGAAACSPGWSAAQPGVKMPPIMSNPEGVTECSPE